MKKSSVQWRNIIADYFTFSKSQRRAVIILFGAILFIILIPVIYQFFLVSKTVKANDVLVEQVTQLKVKEENNRVYNDNSDREKNTDYSAYKEPAKNKPDLFVFDPNTVSAEDWGRLGVREKTISTIQNYLSKGGHFNKPEDLKKIYGLREEEANRLIPYARISSGAKEAAMTKTATNTYSKPSASTQKIDVNTADTTALISLPGIGSKLASRIILYREKLGGFYTIDQVGETYGISDSTFQLIKPRLVITTAAVRKININTASVSELKMPYIPYNVANAIFQYRTHNGLFKTVDDLKKIPIIDEPLFRKIVPYMTIE